MALGKTIKCFTVKHFVEVGPIFINSSELSAVPHCPHSVGVNNLHTKSKNNLEIEFCLVSVVEMKKVNRIQLETGVTELASHASVIIPKVAVPWTLSRLS